jgi:hypothetical protein
MKIKPILVEIGPGELIDRITILEIKMHRLEKCQQMEQAKKEFVKLSEIWDQIIDCSVGDKKALDKLTENLRHVNQTLWNAEDEIRRLDVEGDFSARFIKIARSIFCHNDERSVLKSRVCDVLGSSRRDEKIYCSAVVMS